ncbi:unnamed protein product [Brachionus calyciflorus]|uniref:Secreted protein n=1 Tax=Brachionus calyciflorus TaxID=104777 RepID=A0A814KVF2_9BILA|nr:unnamed protein product [Brachionus calyciflorus]
MRILNAACIPVLLCGCESWTLTETSSDTLNCLVRTFYRIICGIKQSETHMTNEERICLFQSDLDVNHKIPLKILILSFRFILEEVRMCLSFSKAVHVRPILIS